MRILLMRSCILGCHGTTTAQIKVNIIVVVIILVIVSRGRYSYGLNTGRVRLIVEFGLGSLLDGRGRL